MISALIIQFVGCICWYFKSDDARLCACVGHTRCVEQTARTIRIRLSHYMERMSFCVYIKFVSVAPVQCQHRIVFTRPVSKIVSSLGFVYYRIFHDCFRACTINFNSVWTFRHPIVFSVIYEFVIIHSRIPTINFFFVQPVMIVNLSTMVLYLVDVIIICACELDLVFRVDRCGISICVSYGWLQLISKPVTACCTYVPI